MYVQLLSLGNIGNMGLAWQGMGWSIARPRWHVVAWDCPSPTPRALSSPFIPYAHALCPWTNAAAKEDGQWRNEVWPWAKLGYFQVPLHALRPCMPDTLPPYVLWDP